MVRHDTEVTNKNVVEKLRNVETNLSDTIQNVETNLVNKLNNLIENRQFLQDQLINSQLDDNNNFRILKNSIIKLITSFDNLNIEGSKQILAKDSNNQYDLGRVITINDKNFYLINTIEYNAKATLLNIEILNTKDQNFTLYRFTVNKTLPEVNLNTTYAKEYKNITGKNILIDSIIKCSKYCVSDIVPANLLINCKIIKILFLSGHNYNEENDNYEYDLYIENDKLNIEEINYPLDISVFGNKAQFNSLSKFRPSSQLRLQR